MNTLQVHLAVPRPELLPRVPQRGVEQGARPLTVHVPQDRHRPPGGGEHPQGRKDMEMRCLIMRQNITEWFEY